MYPGPWRRLPIRPVVCALLCACAPLFNVEGQNARCDERIVPLASNANGYRQRGDRCEGMYDRPTGGTTLFIASFTEFFEDFKPAWGDSLVVEWRAAGDSVLHIRGETWSRDRVYRLDAFRPSWSGSFVWPTNLLAVERVAQRELTVAAWTRQVVGDTVVPVYVPLRIRQRQAAKCGSFRLVFWPGESLRDIRVSVVHLDAKGDATQVVRRDEPLKTGRLPAETPIPYVLDAATLGEAGTYHMRLALTLESGGTSDKDFWLYLPGKGSCPR